MEEVYRDMLSYVEEVYKDDAQKFNRFLANLEKEDDEGARKVLETFKILDDTSLTEQVRKIVFYGFVYDQYYHEERVKVQFPIVVEEDDKGRKTINYDKLTTFLIRRFCVVSFGKTLYVYDSGVFREGENAIAKEIERILISQGIADKKKIRETVAEILARIHWRTAFREFPFNRLGSEFIPLKNGVLWRKDSYLLLRYSPAFGYTYRLPVTFNPDAECPKIDKFLSEIVREKDVEVLYEIAASCLLQSPEFHYAYMLYGQGGNGKSTFLNLLQKFLGEENVANVSLQDLTENRFKASQLVGKLANIYADIPKRPLKYTGIFKTITGGDRITVEKKYRDPFEFRNTARLIFSANELPEVNDQTYAFWRRWIVVEFPNKFPPNPDLIKELTTEEELSGFLNKVLSALTRIEIRGHPTVTDTVDEIMQTWMKRSNSVYGFIQDCLVKDPRAEEEKDKVYECYIKYCEINNLPAVKKNVFGQEMQRQGIRHSRVRRQGGRVWVWKGIRINWDYFEEESEGESEEHPEDILDFSNLDSS